MTTAQDRFRALVVTAQKRGTSRSAKESQKALAKPSEADSRHTGVVAAGGRNAYAHSYLSWLVSRRLTPKEMEALARDRWLDFEQPAGDRFEVEEMLAMIPRVVASYGVPSEDTSVLPNSLKEALDREGVQDRLQYIRDVRDAQAIDTELEALKNPKPPVDLVTLDVLLSRPVDYSWLVEDMMPAGGNCLIIAPAKTGKTTLVGSLVYSLLTGAPFLGRFPVRVVKGGIVMLNYEVTAETFGAWLGSLGLTVEQQRRVVVVNLRGRENVLATDAGRSWLTAKLLEVGAEVVTVDPFTEAFYGTSQDNNTEVSQFLSSLRRVVTEGGGQELFLVAHAGHQSAERGQSAQVRVRGASVLEGWTDANWRLSKPANMDGDPRFFEADGRDVRLEKDRLDFDHVTRRLTLSGAGGPGAARRIEKATSLTQPVLDLVEKTGGITAAGIADGLRKLELHFSKGDPAAAVKVLVNEQRLVQVQDGRATRHYLPTSVPEKFRSQIKPVFPIRTN